MTHPRVNLHSRWRRTCSSVVLPHAVGVRRAAGSKRSRELGTRSRRMLDLSRIRARIRGWIICNAVLPVGLDKKQPRERPSTPFFLAFDRLAAFLRNETACSPARTAASSLSTAILLLLVSRWVILLLWATLLLEFSSSFTDALLFVFFQVSFLHIFCSTDFWLLFVQIY